MVKKAVCKTARVLVPRASDPMLGITDPEPEPGDADNTARVRRLKLSYGSRLFEVGIQNQETFFEF